TEPEQIDPKNPKEMPINRHVIKQAATKGAMSRENAAGQVGEHGNSCHQVQHVHARQNIEERAIGIGREVKAFGAQLLPSHELPNAKSDAKKQGEKQPHDTLAAF